MPKKGSTAVNTAKTVWNTKRIRTMHLESVNFDVNTKGTTYLKGIKEGAVYANLDDIEAGRLYTVVELSKEGSKDEPMIALNKPTAKERLQFFADLKNEFPGLDIAEIKDACGIVD